MEICQVSDSNALSGEFITFEGNSIENGFVGPFELDTGWHIIDVTTVAIDSDGKSYIKLDFADPREYTLYPGNDFSESNVERIPLYFDEGTYF